MLDPETKRRIDTCRDILVGKVPNPQSQVEQITIALIYKFMDDMDRQSEDLGGKRQFFSKDFARYSWTRLMAPNMGGHETLNLYAEAIQKMNENPDIPKLFRDIFKNAYLPYRDPETLRSFLKEIDSFNYDHSERLGDAFEYLLSVLGSQGDAGMFRTPRHIIDFMVDLIDPKKDETILDPACGTAGFLISSYKHILKHNTKGYKPESDHPLYESAAVPQDSVTLDSPLHYKGDRLTPDDRHRIAHNIKGYDISPDMMRLSLVNMYLHGFMNPSIEEYDTLTQDTHWNDYFDVILANPPFMSPKGGIRPHKRFSIQANRSEVLFVDYITEHLTANGRAAIIVPEGVIFQSGTAYKQLRKMLVDKNLLAVISLPAGVFNPYSGVKTSILILDNRLAKKTDKVLFAKIENDGFNLGAQRRPINRNDLPAAARTIKAWLSTLRTASPFDPTPAKNVHLVEKTKFAENGDYNLSGERYVEFSPISSRYDVVRIGNICEINPKKSEIASLPLDTKVSFVPMADLPESEISFHPKETRPIEEMLKGAYTYFKDNDVLIAKVTPCFENGKGGLARHLSNGIGFGSSEYYVLRASNLVLPEFLYYLVASSRFRDYATPKMTGTGGLQRLPKTVLHDYTVPLPPIEVQREIVAEIEEYQKVIDGAKQILAAYKPHIPLNPDWPMVELGSLCKPEYGYTTSAQDSGTHRFIRITDISPEGLLNSTDKKYISVSEDTQKYLLNKGDILVARTGATYGKTVLYDEDEPAIFASYLVRLIFPENQVIPKYYWAFAQSNAYWDQANSLVSGGGQPQFNGNVIVKVTIPLPDLDTQKAIVAEIEKEQAIVNGNKELIRLFETKINAVINRIWGEAG